MTEVKDKIIIYNTGEEINVTDNLVLEQGELALVREKDKERLYIKNTAGVVVPIHNIIDGGEIELPSIQEGWIDSGLAEWVKLDDYNQVILDDVEPFNRNMVKFNSGLTGDFTIPSVNNSKQIKKMNNMFNQCSSLTSLDVSYLDSINVTDMSNVFSYCENLLTLTLNGWNTSNVNDMQSMFGMCENLISLDLNSFNTINVINMYFMFAECKKLTSLDLSSFDTSKVTDMSYMFSNCLNLTLLDLSSWDISNVIDIYEMFSGCTSLKTIKCTKATQDKIFELNDSGLPTDFNGWDIV